MRTARCRSWAVRWAGVTACALVFACGGKDHGDTCITGDTTTCGFDYTDVFAHPCEQEVASTCGTSSSDSTCAHDTMAKCATDYYLRNYTPNTLPDCDPSHPPLTIGDGTAKLALSFYRYLHIDDKSVVRHSQGLQRYYAEDGLTMTTDNIAQQDEIRYAIAGTLAEVTQALNAAGVDPNDSTQEAQAERIIGNVIFKPTREFFNRHSLPAERKVNVAVIDQIISPDMVKALGISPGTVVVGLGLSSSLINRLTAEGSSGEGLNTMLNIGSDFTPTLFVGHTDIARLTGNFDLVVAHEMGHAMGLPHVTDSGNLMYQGGSLDCRPWLGQDQINIMGPFADVVLTPDDALSMILAGRRNILRLLREGQ